MALRLYSLIIGLFIWQNLQAQSIVMISDETKTGFKLVAEGFIQNEVFLEKINIKGLPLEGSELYFVLKDGRSFRRKLPSLAKGNHQYIIYQDYEGHLRLRYRGKYDKLKQSALLFNFNQELPFTFPEKILAAREEKSMDVLETSVDTSRDEKVIAVISAEEIKAAPRANPIEDRTINIPAASDDTATAETENSTLETSKEPEPESFNFDAAVAEINTSNFEFDKLQLAKKIIEEEIINTEQLLRLLKSFKYDQSRLDLVKSYSGKEANSPLNDSILVAFDYELSKQAVKKIIDETSRK